MTLTIDTLLPTVDDTDDGYNSQSFRESLESMMQYLKTHSTTTVQVMGDYENVRFKGDLAGWLLTLNIRENYHWVVARMNDLSTPSEYDGLSKSFRIPDTTLIDTLLQKHRQKLRA